MCSPVQTASRRTAHKLDAKSVATASCTLERCRKVGRRTPEVCLSERTQRSVAEKAQRRQDTHLICIEKQRLRGLLLG